MRDGNTYWAIVSLGLAMVLFFIAWPVYRFFKYYVRGPFKWTIRELIAKLRGKA